MSELLAPVKLMETSVTERADFRTCRRRWFLNTVKRYTPIGGAPYFWFGNLIHYALEHYYLGIMEDDPDPEEYGRLAFQKFFKESILGEDGIKAQLGFLWEQAHEEYESMAAMGEAMLDGYFRMERETGTMGKPIAVEERYRVPIVTLAGRALPGTPMLTGRFDLVVEWDDGSIWVVDHKALSSKHSSSYLDIDDQLTGYAYVYYRATGTFPRGQVYNVLLKKAPHPPKLLQSGKLSMARDQATTYSLYLGEIKRLGLNRADYAEHLQWLKGKGWGDFYVQEGVFRNMAQLRRFEHDLYYEWMDMRDVAAHPDKAYPSPSSINCPGCPVRLICAAMQDEGDVDAIIGQQFSIAPVRR